MSIPYTQVAHIYLDNTSYFILIYLAKFGDIQNMKAENHKHIFIL